MVRNNQTVPFKTTQDIYNIVHPPQILTDPESPWVNGRLSVAGCDKLKKRIFADMFKDMIDTDYEVKEAEWWEKVLAIVIVVVAIVVTVASMGSLAGLTVPAAAGALAFAFAMGALTLTIGAAILGYLGGPSAQQLVKVIGKFANTLGIVATVLGIYAGISSFVRKMSKEGIMEAAKKKAE